MSPDVVVIGGGPAGLAASIESAAQGLSTVLVERRTFPIDKACGEGLLPNAVELAEKLGLVRAEMEGVGRRIAGVRYVAASGVVAEGRFDRGAGIGLRRVHLSAMLVARARAFSNLEIVTGQSATIAPLPGGGFEVRIASDRLQPRLVVVADGLGSRLARSTGIEFIARRPARWGVRQHFNVEPWTDCVEVHFAEGCDAYVTPVDCGVNVAVLWNAARRDWPAGSAVMANALEQFPALASRLKPGAAVDKASASGPFLQRPHIRAQHGLLLMGDAAGYIDPLTGEGVGLALSQAALFGEQVALPMRQTTGGGVVRSEVLGRYLAATDRASRSNQQLTHLLLRLSARQSVIERVVAAMRADPELLAHCLAANMGERAAWRLPLMSAMRLPLTLARQNGGGS